MRKFGFGLADELFFFLFLDDGDGMVDVIMFYSRLLPLPWSTLAWVDTDHSLLP